MRFSWAGLFVLLLAFAGGAHAQATGQVRELGFQGFYRADCCVPLLVHLDSTTSTAAEYQIQVHQQDLDQDTVVYKRTVTLGPNAHEDFWVYFLPQPTNGGLNGPGGSLPLGDVLKVHLYDKAGKTHVAALPVQAKAADLERAGGGGAVKLVLAVRGEQANAHGDEYVNAQGTSETVQFISVTPDKLPDNVMGYQAVDAVAWLNANWSADGKSSQPAISPASFSALQQWVRRGGSLAVCQPAERSQLDLLDAADMLPIVARQGVGPTAAPAIQIRTKRDVQHLATIVTENAIGFTREAGLAWELLDRPGQAYEVAWARPRPDAMVDAWVTWDVPADVVERTPFIARRAYGSGAVTWVAQNLSTAALATVPNPAFRRGATPPLPETFATTGWPRIWDRVFGWRNQTRTAEEVRGLNDGVKEKGAYAPGTPVDLGAGVIRDMEHSGRSKGYVFVAVLFFIAYWAVAGPLSFFYLARRKKKGLSWSAFGVTALAATVLTVLLVKLLLGGGAEVKHVTVVRMTPDAPAVDGSPRFAVDAFTRAGVYIPKDGPQAVALPAAPAGAEGADRSAAVGPFAIPPAWLRKDTDAGFTDTARYVVDTDPTLTGKAPEVDFFFRSTLKKVQAQWSGSVADGILGSAELTPEATVPGGPGTIAGRLTNKLGLTLRNVYVVFSYGRSDANAGRLSAADRVLFLPKWDDGTVVDLAESWRTAGTLAKETPGSSTAVKASINPRGLGDGTWDKFWYAGLPTGYTSNDYDDRSGGNLHALPLMSLVDRVGPFRRPAEGSDARPEPARRGFRDLDVSPLVASGRLVILGQAARSAVPMPLSVNEDRVGGDGTTFYQVALPLGREKLAPPPPTSQPATTRATTAPAEGKE